MQSNDHTGAKGVCAPESFLLHTHAGTKYNNNCWEYGGVIYSIFDQHQQITVHRNWKWNKYKL